jgi:hypothetical protein
MPEEPIFLEDPIQWMYREWRRSIEGTPTDRILDLIEGGARTVEGFIQGVREAGESVQRDLQAWVTDPGRKLEELQQIPGLVVAGWGAMLKPVADGLASARTLLEQVLAGIRADPTLTLSVDPQNLADLHAAASALGRVVEACQRLHRTALGLAEGAGLAFDEDAEAVRNAWAGLMMAGAEGPAQTLAKVFHEASRFMVDVLARNGQSGNPVAYYPPIRIPPAFSKPRVPLMIVAVAELPGRLGAMEKSREELAEAVGGLRLALSRLETWEGYARLGFRDGVEQAYAVLERFAGPVMMGILNEARPLPSMAQEMASTISRIAPVDTSVLRLYSPPHNSIVDVSWMYLEHIQSVSDRLASQLGRSANHLLVVWSMRDGATAADEMRSWGQRAREVVGGTAQRILPLLRALLNQWNDFKIQAKKALLHHPQEMIRQLRVGAPG